MDKAYYLEYYTLERNHWWFRARLNIIELLIGSLTTGNKKILNVGAATGATSIMLQKYGDVTSLEYDKDCCEFTSSKTGLEIINGSITELPFENNTFDFVCAFDVIEHVEDHQKAAQELIRTCKPGGYIFCTVPAYQFLWSKHDEVNQHFRRYRLRDFSNLFQGISHIYKGYFNFFLFPMIAILRLSDKILKLNSIRKDAGSDFSIIKNTTLNSLFFKIMNAEIFFIKKRISLPFGVSILFSAQKNK